MSNLANLNLVQTPFGNIPARDVAQFMPEGPANKTLIIQACRQILRSKFGRPSEKLKAAYLLERVMQKRTRKENLAPAPPRARRRTTNDDEAIAVQTTPAQTVTDILSDSSVQ